MKIAQKPHKSLVETISVFPTELTADCVECNSDFCVCATYELVEARKTRIGRLFVFDIGPSSDPHKPLRELRSLRTDTEYGIFDVKFRPSASSASSGGLLCAAGSHGSVDLFSLPGSSSLKGDDEPSLTACASCAVSSSAAMCLFADWDSYGSSGSSSCQLVSSQSDGTVSLCKVCPSRPSIDLLRTWKAHDYECWTAAFMGSSSQVLSGADDSRLCLWDLRVASSEGPHRTNRSHGAGVCCISPMRRGDDAAGESAGGAGSSGSLERTFVTGSYDDTLRIFDVRSMKAPVSQVGCGGGVWRVRPVEVPGESGILLLAACMRGGFKLLRCGGDKEPEVIATFHDAACKDALAYGIGLCRFSESEGMAYVGSCSFYDRQMQYWSVRV